jgi:hypothetical protein
MDSSKEAPATPAQELQRILEILQRRGEVQGLQQRALQALEKHVRCSYLSNL